jgi:hypothetical protein
MPYLPVSRDRSRKRKVTLNLDERARRTLQDLVKRTGYTRSFIVAAALGCANFQKFEGWLPIEGGPMKAYWIIKRHRSLTRRRPPFAVIARELRLKGIHTAQGKTDWDAASVFRLAKKGAALTAKVALKR